MDAQRPGPPSGGNHRGLAKMVVVALCAFAFTFALVPLYRIACEKVFGIRLAQTASYAQAATP